MRIKNTYKQLDELMKTAKRLPLTKNDKWVIFSDLHMGNHSKKDDFLRNSDLFKTAMEYYDQREYNLFLNGDVEELQRYTFDTIRSKWNDIYELFDKFDRRNALYKTFGNHDLEFSFHDDINKEFPARESFVLEHKKGVLFLFHGHQASHFYFRFNKYVGWILKYVANPLRIANYSVSHNSRKQYKIEKRVYHYSVFKNIISIIGHTHRPLFESLSKAERLKVNIENLCRIYAQETDEQQIKEIKKTIKSYKKELKKIYKKKKNIEFESHLYNEILHIPCLFNSGTVIGKRGMTCLEISNNNIRLVHWFDQNLSDRYLNKRGYEPQKIDEKGHYRMTINSESLDYVFARIKLLG